MPVHTRRLIAAAAAATFGFVSFSAQAAAPTFAAPAHYAVGGLGGGSVHTDAVAAGDFNGDGYPDLVSADYYSGLGPRVMLNNGNGTFQAPGTVVTLQPLVGVVDSADLNGDGKDDLIATNAGSIWVLLSNGNGTFTQSWNVTEFQGGQEGVELADVNGDGKLDLGVQLRYGVKTYLGNGNGSFGTGVLTVVPDPTLSSFVYSDINNDGTLDMVLSLAFIGQSILTYLGNGDGSFTFNSLGVAPLVPGDVMVTDTDGDGKKDVVVLAEFSPTQNILVFKGNGTGGFTNPLTPARYNGGYFTGNAGMADFNNDGIQDVVIPDVTSQRVTVIIGDGNGGFTAGSSTSGVLIPQGPAVADFNQDGKLDIAVQGLTSIFNPASRLSVIRNTTP
ncbi:FG-GAP repeat domain-containing protein [Solimonas sp. K1W22B-7]|uniref:FG-GAP repeat domain-containing protein n=1 Tax=Solimonas sp. K1W22B-7 TaxID=2303331 RepID=UPI0013C52795|nr:VCBS repeat-containing protein [Solimonas sp. K1W22B-7]